MTNASTFDWRNPISDPDQLWARDREFSILIKSVRGEMGGRGHAIILGPAGSGRSSLLRCMETELGNLDPPGATIQWRISDPALASAGGTWRSLISSIIESCPESPAVQRWRERTWLGSSRELDDRDRLTSGLVYARSHEVPDLDPHILASDLRELRSLLGVDKNAPCVLSVDDAEPLTEDVELVECLVDALDASGWTLVLAGGPTAAGHLVEARSTLMRRIGPIRLRPLSLREVERCLEAGGALADRLPQDGERRFELVRSVAQLAGGSPLLVSHVAQALHHQAELLRLEELELTVPVLRKTLAGVQALRLRDEDLLPLTRLSAEELELALSIVPYQGLRLEQIARARCLGVRGADDLCRKTAVGEAEMESVLVQVSHEVERLDELGVVHLDQGANRFTTAGGIAAHVLYETLSRELLDRSTTPLPFGSDFVSLVGGALERTLFHRVVASQDSAVCILRTAARGGSEYGNDPLRPVIEALEEGRTPDFGRLRLHPENPQVLEVLAEILRNREGALVLLSGTVRSSEGELEYAEAWASKDPAARFDGIDSDLLDEHAKLKAHFEFAGLASGGCSATVRRGPDAALLTCSLFPLAAHAAVIGAYQDGEPGVALSVAELALEAISTQGVVEGFRRAEDHRGDLLNKLGFLNLMDGRAPEAEQLFRQVLEWSAGKSSDASRWLYEWNLAQSLFAQGRQDEAEDALLRAEDQASETGAGGVHLLCSSKGAALVPFELEGKLTQAELKTFVQAQRTAITRDAGVSELLAAEVEQVVAMGRVLRDAETAS